jgi:hypothetical protein
MPNLSRSRHPRSARCLRAYDWFESAVDYLLGDAARPGVYFELPGLEAMRTWFPFYVADFFLLQNWHRSTDPDRAAQWAKRLAAISASREEIDAAFLWAFIARMRNGRKTVDRTDQLGRIVALIESNRANCVDPQEATQAMIEAFIAKVERSDPGSVPIPSDRGVSSPATIGEVVGQVGPAIPIGPSTQGSPILVDSAG